MTKGIYLNIYFFFSTLLIVSLFGTLGFAAGGEAPEAGDEVPPIDRKSYEKVETATFALGCFWGGDALFGAQPGVIRTRVGYAGGSTKNPTYRSIGDHTESIQVDYNPEKITFKELANLFWENHDPGTGSYKRQYDKILFYENSKQEMVAKESLGNVSSDTEGQVYTRVEKLENFYPAEDYHQKYRLRNNSRYLNELKQYYGKPDALRDSTAAARLNGYLASYGSAKDVKENLGKLGLSEETRSDLKERFDLEKN
jgi:methionine-S-sulfoxide reductase